MSLVIFTNQETAKVLLVELLKPHTFKLYDSFMFTENYQNLLYNLLPSTGNIGSDFLAFVTEHAQPNRVKGKFQSETNLSFQ